MTVIKAPGGRQFIAQGVEPYQRLDGTWTHLRVWQGACRACGAPFIVKTPVKVTRYSSSKSFERMNCRLHKGQRVRRATR